ncbi:hypothetical protein EW146_g9802 [Bondarzewia mesenterica]|uniref:Uncharacterized protein n=1 Tax=Bondarzewia mesenterica TaxID=1095465 RepID=A0A4S4L3C5_9AGAM|nr:hypothetical protein EW146_g9802 [Bondarzewia mesenterica]
MSFRNTPSNDYDRCAQYIVSQEPNGSVQTYCRWDGDGNIYRHIHRIPHPSQLSKESTLDGALGDEFPLTLAAVQRASTASITDTAPLPWVATLSRDRLILLSTAAAPSFTRDIAVQPVVEPPYTTNNETSSATATPLNLAEDQPMMNAPPLTAGAYPMGPNTSSATAMSGSSNTASSLRCRPHEVISRPASHLRISLQTAANTDSAEGGKADDDSLAIDGVDTVDDILEQDVPETGTTTVSSLVLGLSGIPTEVGQSESGHQDPPPTATPEAPPPAPLQTQAIITLEAQPPQTEEEGVTNPPANYYQARSTSDNDFCPARGIGTRSSLTPGGLSEFPNRESANVTTVTIDDGTKWTVLVGAELFKVGNTIWKEDKNTTSAARAYAAASTAVGQRTKIVSID